MQVEIFHSCARVENSADMIKHAQIPITNEMQYGQVIHYSSVAFRRKLKPSHAVLLYKGTSCFFHQWLKMTNHYCISSTTKIDSLPLNSVT